MEPWTIRNATALEIEEVWRRWGGLVVTLDRVFRAADVQGIAALDGQGALVGLLTAFVAKDEAEIVSLDAFAPSQGIGTALVQRAEAELAALSIDRVRVVTTSDNIHALGFYLRRGYRLLAVHLDAMDRVRAIKPSVSATGQGGLALRDMWELAKTLPRPA
jgi:GNAT superfamily N-acetyltransferase